MMCGRLGGDSTSRLPKAPVKKRILILTVHHGASHERVAKALRRALLDADPELTVEIADALEHTAKWFRFYYDSYLVPLKLWPGLWARIENAQHSRFDRAALALSPRRKVSLPVHCAIRSCGRGRGRGRNL